MASKKATSVTTRRGDKGETGLRTGRRVSKGDLLPEALGAVDELNSLLGLIRASTKRRLLREKLLRIQNQLFIAGAELAAPDGRIKEPRIREAAIEFLERIQEELEPSLDLPSRFVLYGGSRLSAELDLARAVARRAERAVRRACDKAGGARSLIPRYMNRLSDLLFILARYVDKKEGVKAAHPDYVQE